ncbi:SNF2-related protein [Rhodocyclus purpureus]|uniref:SNF2-related protein n=1 Tax=Rhodocyclus purpureus TaxID=1067 RepID=UPI0019139FE2
MSVVFGPKEVIWLLPISLNEWIGSLPLPSASAIANAIEAGEARISGNKLSVPAFSVATWSESVARGLGLPPNVSLGFDIRLSGAIGKPGASVAVRWLQPGKTVPARDAQRNGLWLEWRGQTFRIPSPIFQVLSMVEDFNRPAADSWEEQFRLWARIRQALGEEHASGLTDGFLRSFRVVTASFLTFSIITDDRGDVQVEPVLLAARPAADGGGIEHVRALTEVDERLFPQRLDQLREGVPAFPITQGTYVVVDEHLQQALAAVRKLRKAPAEQRKCAAMRPEASIRELLGLDDTAPSVFVETEHFAERVRDVGEWTAPVLPWIKIDPQNWAAPTASGVRVDGVEIPLDKESLSAAVSAMRQAITAEEATSIIGDKSVPATPNNLKALEQLQSALEKRETGSSTDVKDQGTILVLIIETNFEQASFNKVSVGKRPGTIRLPGGLRTSPKPHQEFGVQWLQRHWLEGSRGAMLCDDMGLGKTFQALAFCQWLRELMEHGEVKRKPMLIVAPVGLLRNWEREIEEHLLAPGLGSLVRAYGEHLRSLRRGRHLDGTAVLDTARLASGDVVLANYEAVSDYQLSFGAVLFSAVILDEAQKIKSPKARMTHAAKALNADFVVALTGTPVENRLADLWCIADTVQPGALADLKSFSARYEGEGADVAALRSLVWQDESHDTPGAPKMLLRRLKSDKLEGLPRKHEHVVQVSMPERQREAYMRAIAVKELSGPEGTLGMIHALRRISLHPVLIEGTAQSSELLVEDSARLKATIEILDRIAEKGEKVLIFLESLDLQEADQLPLLLKRRYGLPRLPMVINGQVSTEARQERVDLFQRDRGFDVMLLSPKAGGVGLTLTAANHVVHLSRWWNPAVEDQCSDRVYRIGQTKPVHIYYPLAVLPEAEEFSFDMQLQQLMNRKRELAQNLLAAPAFTKEDYDALLAGTLRAR